MAERLEEIAARLMTQRKGLLAADESTGTAKKRLAAAGVTSTEETRRDSREMLFRAEEAMTDYISGVILYDETIRQKAADGTPLVELITRAGALAGIKVDEGAVPLALHPGETVTEGLDGLRERLAEYHGLGARFAKWRAAISISDVLPSRACVRANNRALARYAALCQEAGLVPIVEPEVLMDGDPGTHSIERCAEVSEAVQRDLFEALVEAGVTLEQTILKPNMVIDGAKARRASVEEVAEMTVRTFRRTVPTAIAGIAFLSGGQSSEEATAHLNAMKSGFDLPWPLTFSYSRALQEDALKAWAGKSDNVAAGQRAFVHRSRMNSLAERGEWNRELEDAA
ncbi:class I fructose-bisphosphate aldolase [Pararhizobium mangrovi]|uniref:Probable fructose-bisphosphate aldolase class 1 n=1 Tax=Pararhizobium mangrovi TaxID=2590452 RepID=A0A506U2A4_9HYPH|nr:class I fructose-bisphosphate aldolase [Pararhizobium mangrovi]TPW27598.1 fructose-bisphosphate aldolase class I [Pararhizobium mangrovi]